MMTRDQLRAARILLHLDQRDLAAIAKVGVATVRRFEGGEDVSPSLLDSMRRAVEEAGAIMFGAGTGIDGSPIAGGVALRRLEDCSPDTRERLASDTFNRRKTPVKPDGRAARARSRSAQKPGAENQGFRKGGQSHPLGRRSDKDL